MTLIDYTLYGIWCFFPFIFLMMALWAQLEKFSDKSNRDNIADFLKQAWFLSVCVVVALLIDIYLIKDIVEIIPFEMPLLFYRIILFPIVAFALGYVFGGSKKIETEKNPLLKYNRKRGKK